MLANSLELQLIEEENVLKQEGKMTTSKRRILINYLVEEVTKKVIQNDEIRINNFARASSLSQYTKFEDSDLIKL